MPCYGYFFYGRRNDGKVEQRHPRRHGITELLQRNIVGTDTATANCLVIPFTQLMHEQLFM